MLRFHTNQNAFVLSLVEVVDPDLPGAGNVKVKVSVTCEGFTGRRDAWVAGEAWARWCTELRQLDATKAGEAKLESLTDGQLVLCITTEPDAGALRISGSLSQNGLHASDAGKGLLNFSFPCDAVQLAAAIEAVTCMSWR